MRFFTGLHHPNDAQYFESAFVSINALRRRVGPFAANEWILDSGAFSTIDTYGGYPNPPEAYADQVRRWSTNANLLAAVAEDYMCEQKLLEKTGKTILEHQTLTIDRYDVLRVCDTNGTYIMPVLQGFEPNDYVRHLLSYGERLRYGAWVGVGSVCKRNGKPTIIEAVLSAIARCRPDLRLHGFGLKTSALASEAVRDRLHSADSMAWSYAARRQGRDANSWREARRFTDAIVRSCTPSTITCKNAQVVA